MKKRKKLLIGALLILLFPILVLADMGSPEITTYEVRVTSINGTNLVDWEGKTIASVAYDTVLKITMEEERSGILYGGTEVNKKWGYVKLSDTTLVKKEIDLKDFTKAKEPQKRYVFTEGAYLYNGPSTIYGKVEGEVMIPKGSTITYEYSDDCWAYVEYNGTKGWVYIYTYKEFGPYDVNSSLAYFATAKENKVITLEEVELVNNPVEEKKTGIKIPKGQEVNYDYYYYAHPKDTYFHVTYGDEEGWVETKKTENGKATISATDECKTVMIIAKSIPLYKDYFEEDSKSTIEIPFGTELKVIYAAYGSVGESSWYYIEYEGHKGWIKDISYETDTPILDWNFGFISNYTAIDDIPLYEDLNKKEQSAIIKKDSKFQVLYSHTEGINTTWLYVRGANYEGWILQSPNAKYETDDEVCIDIVAKGEIDPVEEKEKEETTNKEEQKEKLSSKMILILCIGGAIALAITAGTTLAIIHKTKKETL